MEETKLSLQGKSGRTFQFFPKYNITSDGDKTGDGIYVFTNRENEIADIQFLSGDEVKATLSRMKNDDVTDFYFADGTDRLQADADIDDMKEGKEFRKKSD